MASQSESIAEILRGNFSEFTRAEKQLADSILGNYPMSGLGSITAVAQDADVSTPTVVRMVQKLGFKGFPEFQRALRGELQAQITDPIAKRETWAEGAPNAHILNRFTESVIGNISQTLAHISTESFDATCDLLADMDRAVYVVGGRITRAMADYFFLHMQVLRPKVTHIQSISNAWPHYLLEVEEGDVVVIFDVRRYENSTLKLAEMAAEKGAVIILFTDQWLSPIEKIATHTFSCRIVVPSAWDSSIAPMLLLETVVAAVQERTWETTRPRMEALEDMFDRTRFFRKFT